MKPDLTHLRNNEPEYRGELYLKYQPPTLLQDNSPQRKLGINVILAHSPSTGRRQKNRDPEEVTASSICSEVAIVLDIEIYASLM